MHTKILSDLINKFNKVEGYKKATAFLYTNNEQSKKEIKNAIYNSIKKNKLLRNNLN